MAQFPKDRCCWEKGLNIGYNTNYNKALGWFEAALKNRQKAFVHFHPHCEIRIATRNVEVEKIVETVHTGKIFKAKSMFPNKIAFKRFFKDGFTYVAITEAFPNSFQVKTVWRKKGKI